MVPEGKYNEIRTFVEGGLQDFSISRLKSKMPWGVPVPNDPDQVMYVWFDALVNYISTLDWPQEEKKFKEFWPGVQVAGKDNLRQQTAIWQAMLMSAGLPNSKQIFIHGFITVDGQKISKSLGNTINPIELTEKYGTEAVRYFLLAKVNPYDDSDFSYEKFEDAFNGELANGLGNLISRIAKLCERIHFKVSGDIKFIDEVSEHLDEYRLDMAMESIWKSIKELDAKITKLEPWKMEDEWLADFLLDACVQISSIGYSLSPFMPETSKKILDQFNSGEIKSGSPLFPRLAK